MGDPKGFMKFERQVTSYKPVDERLQDYNEFDTQLDEEGLKKQGARCMDCGVPFCHIGCPLGNLIPDWNDLTFRGRMEDAITQLHATNNFPEFTGRVCPAPCEASCVLGINQPPVTIKQIERHLSQYAFDNDLIVPLLPEKQSGKKVAVVGSGPAGMAAAQQLARAGHDVTLYERADRIGGLLRYGIPDFKMEKHWIDKRVEQMEAEGVTFKTNANIGVDISTKELQQEFDAVLLTGGATQARGLPIPGGNLKGVHLAMNFLTQQNKRVAGDDVPDDGAILATDKDVVILGGGDTGSDCLGTSHRHHAKSICQYELLAKPQEAPAKNWQWPFWPNIMRTSSSQEEGGMRDWGILTKEFIGDDDGRVKALKAVRVTFDESRKLQEVPGSEFEQPCNLVLLALGFLGPEQNGAISELGLELTDRGNVKCGEDYQTSVEGVFAAGDMRRGQSLVVWAIVEGREAAYEVDKFLMGYSNLPNKDNQFNTAGSMEMRR